MRRPPTPAAWRFAASSRGRGLLAEPGGTTHAGTLGGNACADDTIAAYLATGALPARRAGDRVDAYCTPLPEPVPGRAAADGATVLQLRVAQRPALLAGH